MAIIQLLAVNAGVSGLLFIALWLISIRIQDPSFIDSWWPLGMVVMAVTSLVWVGRYGIHGVLLTGLCALWGLRLGLYLLWRWRNHGADRRYVSMMANAKKERGWGFPLASLLLVFALQYPLQYVVCLPVQLGQIAEAPLGFLGWAGTVLAVVGILFETVGDDQLTAFKANPENNGKVLQTGLWRYTRHPNYFGDACLWWGLYLIAAETGLAGALTFVGPVLITFLLTRWSGVPTTEGRMRRRKPDYEAYVARTSGFIPWIPKKA